MGESRPRQRLSRDVHLVRKGLYVRDVCPLLQMLRPLRLLLRSSGHSSPCVGLAIFPSCIAFESPVGLLYQLFAVFWFRRRFCRGLCHSRSHRNVQRLRLAQLIGQQYPRHLLPTAGAVLVALRALFAVENENLRAPAVVQRSALWVQLLRERYGAHRVFGHWHGTVLVPDRVGPRTHSSLHHPTGIEGTDTTFAGLVEQRALVDLALGHCVQKPAHTRARAPSSATTTNRRDYNKRTRFLLILATVPNRPLGLVSACAQLPGRHRGAVLVFAPTAAATGQTQGVCELWHKHLDGRRLTRASHHAVRRTVNPAYTSLYQPVHNI
jgi:hypothetical protein